MATAASGTLSKLLANLRTLIANSSTFQTLVGHAANATLAAAHIHLVQTDPAGSDVRPFAVIGFDNGPSTELESGGSRNFFTISGRLWVAFEVVSRMMMWIPELNEFTNQVGAILSDMELLAGSGAYLNMTGYSVDSCGRSDEGEEEAEGEFYQAVVTIEYWGKGA